MLTNKPTYQKTIVFIVACITLIINSFSSAAQSKNDFNLEGELSYGLFIEWVKLYHPVAKQAKLQVNRGEEQLRAAKGLFDPVIYSDWKGKDFKDTRYYNQRAAGISLPTTLGIDFIGQFEQNTGTFLNPEMNVPDEGLFTAGVAINVGNGLLIDRFRAQRQKAKIFREAAENEQVQILNNLFLNASVVYWNWSGNFNEQEIISEALDLATERFEFVKKAYIGGELPAIDTVEAYAQVQLRKFQLEEATRKVMESRFDLSVFLWNDDEEPIVPTEATRPQLPMFFELGVPSLNVLRSKINKHPELVNLNFGLDVLDVDRRLTRELLRPKLAFKYNFLREGLSDNFQDIPFTTNNFQYGINFSFPIFNRTARANYNLAKIQIRETTYTLQLTEQRLKARLEAEYTSFEQLKTQLGIYQNNLNALERILEGERMRFDFGESSLFLVNARENAVVDASLVFNTLQVRKNIQVARTLWASGDVF
jgi:outer membrane protein TolC